MSGMGAIAAIASLAGTAISVAGTIATGQAQARAAEYQAKQDDIQAKEERPAAQHSAQEYQRRCGWQCRTARPSRPPLALAPATQRSPTS